MGLKGSECAGRAVREGELKRFQAAGIETLACGLKKGGRNLIGPSDDGQVRTLHQDNRRY